MVKPGVRVLLWGVTAAVVTVVASFAIAASVVAGGNVLSRDDVARALTPTPTTTRTPGTTTGANPTSTAPTPAGSTTTAPTGGAAGSGATDRIVSGASGSVTVRCNGDVATLLSWSPNPGYRADDPVRGPAATVGVNFESDVAEDMIVTATCAGGQVSVTETPEPDDHGGGPGRGGSDD
jgi:serine/threonine-protein kinase